MKGFGTEESGGNEGKVSVPMTSENNAHSSNGTKPAL